VNIKNSFFIRQAAISTGLVFFTSIMHAADITLTVDNLNPENDVSVDLNLSRLLPIAEGNTWTYNLMKGTNPTSIPVTAEVGSSEKIGGGCLALNPIVFGEALALYVGNYGEYVSLHGIYLENWKGLNDVVMKFESRDRVYWKDFQNRYTTGAPKSDSCQDTEWGRTERTGLVFLEDLTENLGEEGNTRGEINCKTKNSDLRTGRVSAPIQTGSGTVTVKGAAYSFSWNLDSLVYTEDYLAAGDLRIQMTFNPNINSTGNIYTMYIDMTLRSGVGIVDLQINDDASYNMDVITDLSYDFVDSSLTSSENQITPKGKCPEDEGSFSLFMILMLLGSFPLSRALRVSHI